MNGGHPLSYSMQHEAKIALRAYNELMRSTDYKSENRYKMPKTRCRSDSYPIKCYIGESWRSFDGSCNNLEKPWWGTAVIPFQRFAEPVYDDGYK